MDSEGMLQTIAINRWVALGEYQASFASYITVWFVTLMTSAKRRNAFYTSTHTFVRLMYKKHLEIRCLLRLEINNEISVNFPKNGPWTEYQITQYLMVRFQFWTSDKSRERFSLSLLSGPLWSGVVVAVRVPTMSRIDQFKDIRCRLESEQKKLLRNNAHKMNAIL